MARGVWVQSRQPLNGPGCVRAHTVYISIQNNILPDSLGSPCNLATLQETGNKHTGGHGSLCVYKLNGLST